MGDAMSSAILRLFKHSREVLTPSPTLVTPLDGGTSRRASLQGEELLVFDASFRDDIRLFCTRPPVSPGITYNNGHGTSLKSVIVRRP